MTTVNIKPDSASSPDYKHSFLTNDFFSLEIGQTWVRLIMQKRIILCSEDLVIDANGSRGPRVNRNHLYPIMHRKVGCWGRLGDGSCHKKLEKHVGYKAKPYVYCQSWHLLHYGLFHSRDFHSAPRWQCYQTLLITRVLDD